MEPSRQESERAPYKGPERRHSQEPYPGKERRRLDWPFPSGPREPRKAPDERS